MTDPESADVVIAGAGPTGLMLAIELCLAGIQPVVLDPLPVISEIPKGNGLIGQIVAVLDYRGLLDRFRPEATYTGGVPSFAFGPVQLDFGPPQTSPLQVLAVPQRRLEVLLTARLAELGGSIRRGHALTGMTQDPGGVTVTVSGPPTAGGGRAENYQVRAQYLAGCDGAHSPVRKLAGIGFPGYSTAETSRIGRVTVPAELIEPGSGAVTVPGVGRLEPNQQFRTAAGTCSLAPLASLDKAAARDTYIVYTLEDPAAEAAAPAGTAARADLDTPMTLAELQDSVRRILGAELPMSSPQWLTRLVANSRQADRYQAGRILLVGDAAHVFGLGGSLNAGLLDALNLGWKLAAAALGDAPAGLLASYHAERHAAGQRTLLQTRSRRALSAHGETAEALRDLVTELSKLPGVARHLGELMAGSDVRYPMPGAPAGQDFTGRLAPDLRLTTPDGRKTSVAELMRTARPLLLDLSPDGAAAKAAGSWNQRVPVLMARQQREPDDATPAAMLIRPDCIVAWAAGRGAAEPTAGLAQALQAWFGPDLT